MRHLLILGRLLAKIGLFNPPPLVATQLMSVPGYARVGEAIVLPGSLGDVTIPALVDPIHVACGPGKVMKVTGMQPAVSSYFHVLSKPIPAYPPVTVRVPFASRISSAGGSSANRKRLQIATVMIPHS